MDLKSIYKKLNLSRKHKFKINEVTIQLIKGTVQLDGSGRN